MLIIHIRYALSIKHLIHINMSVAATPLTRPSNSHIGPHSQKGMNNQRKRMKGTKKNKGSALSSAKRSRSLQQQLQLSMCD